MRVCCLGSGPSLTPEAVESCRPFFTIAINSTVDLAPWAQVCFAADYHWWDARKGLPGFAGQRVGMAPFGNRYPDVDVWSPGREGGLEWRERILAKAGNSGFSAINYAVRIGATEIVLLGYDMQSVNGRHHWHAPHHEGDPHPNYVRGLNAFATLVEPLRQLGISVINASACSALTCFPVARWPETVLDGSDPHLPASCATR